MAVIRVSQTAILCCQGLNMGTLGGVPSDPVITALNEDRSVNQIKELHDQQSSGPFKWCGRAAKIVAYHSIM